MRMAIALFVVIGIGIGLWTPVPRSALPVAPAGVVAPSGGGDAAAPLRAPSSLPSTPAPPPSSSPDETVIERSDNGHYYATAAVNGMPTRFVVDTGATAVALTIDDARRAGILVDPAQFRVVGTGASGDVRGQTVVLDTVALDGRRVEGVAGAVLEGLTVSLLGQSYLAKLDKVEISGGKMKLR